MSVFVCVCLSFCDVGNAIALLFDLLKARPLKKKGVTHLLPV